MTDDLDGTLVLVADDQPDVARSICKPLEKAGARLRFVSDGEAALAAIVDRPLDLLLVDMKMPPDHWGGLWLLEKLQRGGWSIPAVALSGEGAAHQITRALRLGARDWVDKDNAGDELAERCAVAVGDQRADALNQASRQLPTPMAYRFDRYLRTTDPEKRFLEGLHVLESVFRFAATVGLAGTPPTILRRVRAQQLGAPSMGTWLNVCLALDELPNAGPDFKRLWAYLTPDRRSQQTLQHFVSVRNDIAHGRAAGNGEHDEGLDTLLRRFAHRALSAWRAEIAVPLSMIYDGERFAIEALKARGAGHPIPETLYTDLPLVSRAPVLTHPDHPPLPMEPWMATRMPGGPETAHCLLFDGAERTASGPAPDTPLRYSAANGDGAGATGPGTWASVLLWAAP
ncbi:response regulator [Dactylosporangium aurantiacum]|uniref:Response regulator n=1 Tax=Dactylosporangium aurantiacum TaxID=35754 RepID=A0A9Q9MJW1_9ACTN|nr:response regulator [Dactylosporangium aurantiacum]MDG6101937.1 response regulator [Dactylosporangium aurantiacum]UWZ52272.1 response regulator [Dactylosporangium aurantiacum]